MATQGEFAERCLPGDIEVLTEAGWTRGTGLRTGERVAGWHPETGDIALEPATAVEHDRYDGTVISLAGGTVSSTGNPARGVWVRTHVSGDTWTRWHRRSLDDLRDLPAARVPVGGHHSGPGLRRDHGDYAGLLGWISVEAGYHGTSVHLHHTEANQGRAVATASRLAALGARLKQAPGRSGGMVDVWFLPGPLTASIRRDLVHDAVRWPAVWQMNSVELQAFMDGAVGARRRTIHGIDTDTVGILQAVAAIAGHRSAAHDLGRRAGASIDVGAGLDAPITHDAIKRRVDHWVGPAFALTTTTGAVIARRNGRVFVAAT